MFENLKEHYFESISLREKVESRANLRAGITVALGSAVVYLVRSYNFPETWTLSTVLMVVALAVSSLGVVWASFWLGGMLVHSVNYEYVPSQEKMLGYRDGLVDLNKKVSIEKANEITKEDFEENYAHAADHNFDLNKTKASRVYKSGYGVVVAVGAILVAAIPFGMQKVATGSRSPSHSQDEVTMGSPDSDIIRPEKPKNKRISQDEGPEKAEEVDVGSDSNSSSSSSEEN